ncbi:purine nucleoside phosphorylase [Theileria orientalis strain Shintoku]|uniref:Purine nucleoside phosphorylase n=1 Tax=Theileria orientalis strain Shintoku TaxID=869250 RepID=J4D7G0_THEOR|nr:purine nucleoside phosphorylase [Theileria orientalis strain Shintoku]BAM40165.1 purine nucleoside phosphorylase [Theileria orientalis strain Shintoku]|eukprot:XP_009690466.1 purine nucleoside phosphorylase [Theileria orientalis strain Shintoku]
MEDFSKYFFNKTKIPERFGYFKTAFVFGHESWFDIFLTLADSHVEFGTYKTMKSVEINYKGHNILLCNFCYGFVNLNRVVAEAAVLGVKNIMYLNFSLPLKPNSTIKDKDVYVIYASCRNEEATVIEVDDSYPAAAHPCVVRSLREAASALGTTLKPLKSIVIDSFYEKKIKRFTLIDEAIQADVELKDWDSAPMLVFASARDVRSAILTCVGLKPNLTDMNGELSDFSHYNEQMTLMAKTALDACVLVEEKYI